MRKVILVACLLVAAAALIFYFSRDASSDEAGSDAIATTTAVREDIVQSAVAIGTVKPRVGAEVKVGSQLSGVVTRLYVNVGDNVGKGSLLAQLDDSIWRARVDSLSAELAAARAEVEYARTEYERNRKLRDTAVPALQVESNRRNYEVKQAAVEAIRARLDEARVQLGYARITSPVAGTVASVSTYEGETVAASFAAPTFVTIVDLDKLEVQSFVDEADIGKVRTGQAVVVRVDSFPGEDLEGVVDAIYPKAQLVNNVVNYVVIVRITDKKGLLIRPEMTAHVDFVLDRRPAAVTVPRTALLREGGRKYVIVRTDRGWRKRAVVSGIQTSQRVEIRSGLAVGSEIAADAQQWKKLRKESGK